MPRLLAFALVAALALPGFAQDPKPAPAAAPPAPSSRVVAVTVYRDTALVTREVAAPDAAGVVEVVVSPLPEKIVTTSLYAEASDGVRVLSARYRTRTLQEDNRAEVRALELKVKDSQKKLQQIEADGRALSANGAFLTKLENFTAATLTALTEKGQLDPEKTITLATYVRENRAKLAKDEVAIEQQKAALAEVLAFDQKVLQEKSGGVSRVERDAVVTVEKLKPGAATVRLNYLVGGATWRPQYKFRAGTKEKAPVSVEYLAGVRQQTGEDWVSAEITLSTAQPLLNAAPPDLKSLEVAVAGPGGAPGKGGVVFNSNMAQQFGGVGGQIGGIGGGAGGVGGGGFGGGPPGAGGPAGGMPNASAYAEGLTDQAKQLSQQARDNFNSRNSAVGNELANQAAAVDAYRDLVAEKADLARVVPEGPANGPSVTYRLESKFSVPSRPDEQVLEIARPELAASFYYKAVPVLTANVYRIADLVNDTKFVLLAGEATMYLGSDFVGQTTIPEVAVGKPFTVGFGVDPQLQATRKLVERTRTTQGGNQVVGFKYRILINSYKPAPVDIQVWERVPHAEASNAIAVKLAKGETELSKDALYVRDERPRNLLRFDTKVTPKQNGDKAFQLDYEYTMEFAQTVNIAAFFPSR